MDREMYKDRNRKGEKYSNKNRNHKGKLQIKSIIMKKRLQKIKLDENKFKDDPIKYEKYKEFKKNYTEEYQEIRWKSKRRRKSSRDEKEEPKTGRIIYKEFEGQIQ